mmetsp:Transcript_35597/g.41213  ORF Transcript_35597/g.41213 Transcript_35597/m.41213 type:complete len:87 (+) Transcript_35597:77-337(+)
MDYEYDEGNKKRVGLRVAVKPHGLAKMKEEIEIKERDDTLDMLMVHFCFQERFKCERYWGIPYNAVFFLIKVVTKRISLNLDSICY